MRLVIIGPPGAGKGTQAEVLSRELGITHISTGDLFRDHTTRETDLGKRVKSYLDAGDLVPDEVTNEMVRERLAEPDAVQGFLLDGYPRTANQAQVLDGILTELDERLHAVLQFEISTEVVVRRLLERGRQDDTEEVIRRRQEVYRQDTAPLLEHYANLLITVDADGSVDEITKRALDALRERA